MSPFCAHLPYRLRTYEFFMPQNTFFKNIYHFFISSRLMLSILLIEIWPKHAKNDFYFNRQHFQFNDFLTLLLFDKVHAPLRSNPGSATPLQIAV